MLQNEIDFEEIKSRVPISEVLARYTHVPNRRRYRIPCILHNGTGPNLSVDEDRGLYHCFTCGAAGDVISLYAALENLTNIEAAKRLAQDYMIQSYSPVADMRKWVRHLEVYREALELPEVSLPTSRQLNGYRRYSKEAIEHFGLRLTDDGVLIPIKDSRGRTVGWSLRQINREPKYLNSEGLKKGDVLYGLWENQEAIREGKEVILVEGQFDAVRVWDAGYRQVVSSMGAGLSNAQARLLMPLANKIIVLYDGDETGRKKAVELKEKYSSLFNIEIKSLPDGVDPDTADLGAIF